MTKSISEINNDSTPLLPVRQYKPPHATKRRIRKDKQSRDGRKRRKQGKGGKLRHGGYTHRNSMRGWQETFNKEFSLTASGETNPLLILLTEPKQHTSIRVV